MTRVVEGNVAVEEIGQRAHCGERWRVMAASKERRALPWRR